MCPHTAPSQRLGAARVDPSTSVNSSVTVPAGLTELTRPPGTVSHIKYTVFTYSGDDITSGGAPHDFDGPLESEQVVTYGDAEWIVDHVDEEPDPPAVWLRPVSEGDLPV